MEVREATATDAEAVFEAHHAAIEELGREPYDEEQVAAWGEGGSPDDYGFEDPDEFYVVAEALCASSPDSASPRQDAEIDGEVRGFGTLTLSAGEYLRADVDAEVTGVYVHPDAVRQGVGTALLERLEEEARERGIESLGLWASLNSGRLPSLVSRRSRSCGPLTAVPFYEHHGYERVAERTHEFSGGVEGTVLEMRTVL